MQRKKRVYKNKSNPTQSTVNEDIENMPFTSQPTEKKGKCKNKQVMEEDVKGFESEYDSNSFKIVGEEISDYSDDDIADSVGAKKKARKVSKKVYPSFNTKTPMKNIEFEIGLMFTDVKTLRNAIIDYMVEQKREIWFKRMICKGYKQSVEKIDLGYTLMTDQQKGLKHAIDTILPRVEHRGQFIGQRLASLTYSSKGFRARRMPGRPKKHRRREHGEDGGGQKLAQGEASTEGVPQLKRKRGRPPKAKNVKVLPPPPPLPPVGVGVYRMSNHESSAGIVADFA
ncbi:hypothetical protein POM88_025473 [Heracleum sosnowskyi]|uniref:Uncharacterized protein n=1 Tax=Heracleum sosnowskyi TaxID=360622 RepID=A0AAD8I412_9APIA|nr:hypothetical protein POM88_025473 [Heracleum sosnowskyi]